MDSDKDLTAYFESEVRAPIKARVTGPMDGDTIEVNLGRAIS